MVLGGLQKNSMIDYPDKISCVVFFSGCNYDCPYCHNPDLARGCTECPGNLAETDLWHFLEKRKSFLDGVVISGGEPTLQSDLLPFCKKVKDFGYPVKLDTNGSRPEVLQRLFEEGLVDYVAMDIKTDPTRYAPLIEKKSHPDHIITSIRMIMESGLPYEFKTTCIRPLIDGATIKTISRLIRGSRLWALQQFRETSVLHPEFFENQNRTFDKDELLAFRHLADDYVEKCIVR